jgi:hypothetical protein
MLTIDAAHSFLAVFPAPPVEDFSVMPEHLPILAPEEYGEADYRRFSDLLFAASTDAEMLEQICMTLAHLPTQEAQELLARFRNSPRAREVKWLECAIEEGQMHYLSPQNAAEERDLLALKVIQEMEDEVFDLEYEYSKERLRLEKLEIRLEAIRSLMADGALAPPADAGLDDARLCCQGRMAELRQQIDDAEKIMVRIRESIRSERLKQVDTMTMRHWHWDAEGE